MPDSVIKNFVWRARSESTCGGWDMRNRNNKEFDLDDGVNEPTRAPFIENNAHPDKPVELLMVELERNYVTTVAAKPYLNTNRAAAARALANADINLPDFNQSDKN